MVAGAASVRSKKARCTSWVMTVTPSAAKPRRPPGWSKWLWLAMTYRIGLPGASRRVSAMGQRALVVERPLRDDHVVPHLDYHAVMAPARYVPDAVGHLLAGDARVEARRLPRGLRHRDGHRCSAARR
jgi:hypothetical protein